jgi:hypothetical protein
MMTYAFAVPIPPGKTDAVRAFFAEILGPRKSEYADLARRSEVTEEYYWLQSDPSSDLLVVSSHNDQQNYRAILVNPETDFDRWLVDEIRAIFGVEPSPPDGTVNESLGRLVVG